MGASVKPRLVIIRGPSCSGKSTLVRGLAKTPRLKVEYLMSDRFEFYTAPNWYAPMSEDHLERLGRLAGELLASHGDRDILIEECFADPASVKRVVEAAGRSLADRSVVIITLSASRDKCEERYRAGTRRDKISGDFQQWGPASNMMGRPWWLTIDTESKDAEEVRARVEQHLCP